MSSCDVGRVSCLVVGGAVFVLSSALSVFIIPPPSTSNPKDGVIISIAHSHLASHITLHHIALTSLALLVNICFGMWQQLGCVWFVWSGLVWFVLVVVVVVVVVRVLLCVPLCSPRPAFCPHSFIIISQFSSGLNTYSTPLHHLTHHVSVNITWTSRDHHVRVCMNRAARARAGIGGVSFVSFRVPCSVCLFSSVCCQQPSLRLRSPNPGFQVKWSIISMHTHHHYHYHSTVPKQAYIQHMGEHQHEHQQNDAKASRGSPGVSCRAVPCPLGLCFLAVFLFVSLSLSSVHINININVVNMSCKSSPWKAHQYLSQQHHIIVEGWDLRLFCAVFPLFVLFSPLISYRSTTSTSTHQLSITHHTIHQHTAPAAKHTAPTHHCASLGLAAPAVCWLVRLVRRLRVGFVLCFLFCWCCQPHLSMSPSLSSFPFGGSIHFVGYSHTHR